MNVEILKPTQHSMSTETAANTARSSQSASAANPAIQELIEADRKPHVSVKGVWLCGGLSSLLLWLSFTPVDFGALAWLALVPISLLIRIPQRTSWLYPVLYLCGLVYYLITLQWMRLGDPSMYIALVALSLYVAAYIPLFVWLSRLAVHRLRIPLLLTVPMVWAGLEYARAYLLTGFSWYYLGHTQYQWTQIIQISDLVGAYGVSFLVALGNAAIVMILPGQIYAKLNLLAQSKQSQSQKFLQNAAVEQLTPSMRVRSLNLIAMLLCFAAAYVYGQVRMNQESFTAGPRVAIIQGNFPARVQMDPNEPRMMFNRHYQMTGQAVQYQPDLIVWPEGMYPNFLLQADQHLTEEDLLRIAPFIRPEDWQNKRVIDSMGNIARQSGAAMILGLHAATANREDGFRKYNAAAFIRPDLGYVDRYDKIHRVPFGEYIPLRDSIGWLQKLTPYSQGYGIDAGQYTVPFSFRKWKYLPIICFEDTVPHLVAGMVRSINNNKPGQFSMHKAGPPDVLVNLTNDGWFHGSSELDQHLITASFRAVECRIPVVRAVNTGISAVIDGDGVIREPTEFIDIDNEGRNSLTDPETGRRHRQLNAIIIDDVPLDNRSSLYVQYGDWFAMGCLIGCGLCLFGLFLKPKNQPVLSMMS